MQIIICCIDVSFGARQNKGHSDKDKWIPTGTWAVGYPYLLVNVGGQKGEKAGETNEQKGQNKLGYIQKRPAPIVTPGKPADKEDLGNQGNTKELTEPIPFLGNVMHKPDVTKEQITQPVSPGMKKARITTHDYNLGHQEDTKMVTEPEIHPSKKRKSVEGDKNENVTLFEELLTSLEMGTIANINNDVIDQLSLYIERKEEEEKGSIKKIWTAPGRNEGEVK